MPGEIDPKLPTYLRIQGHESGAPVYIRRDCVSGITVAHRCDEEGNSTGVRVTVVTDTSGNTFFAKESPEAILKLIEANVVSMTPLEGKDGPDEGALPSEEFKPLVN